VSEYTPEASFLQELFVALNTSGIRYAIMRNHEPLPYSSGGSDLDVFVVPDDIDAAKTVLLSVVENVDGKVIGIVETWNFFEAYVIGFARGQWWGICVEFYREIAFKSAVPLVDCVALSKHLVEHNNIAVIPDDIGNTIGYIKEILAHDEFRKDKPQYQKSAAHLVTQRLLFREIFSPLGLLGHALLAQLLGNTPANTVQRIRKFRISMVKRAFIRNPFLFIYRRFGHELFRLSRFISPPGAVIAVLGVDGAGKSTVINAILPALNSATHNAVFVQHLRPTLLPPLARLKGKKNLPAGPVLEPHGSTPSGKLGSLLRLAYLTLDYVIGYWLWTRPKIAKRPALVIFDRYAYDMAIDPRRFRIGLSDKVAGWFAALAPKPDLIICLHGSPEVIAARKQELPLEETRRQVEALRAFASREPRAVLISTDASIEETRNQVLHSLCAFLKANAVKQLQNG
jgi:thymidylate kinase